MLGEFDGTSDEFEYEIWRFQSFEDNKFRDRKLSEEPPWLNGYGCYTCSASQGSRVQLPA